MKEIYDVGITFRGFILVNNIFKELPKQKELDGIFIDLECLDSF